MSCLYQPWRRALQWCAVVIALSAAPARAQSGDVGYWSANPSIGETHDPTAMTRVEQDPPASGNEPEGHGREFVLAPLPIINPTLDNGVALVAGALYSLGSGERRSPPSATFLLGMATSNDSWSVGVAQSLRMDADRYRILAALAYLDIHYDFFGIGTSAGSDGRSILVNQVGTGGIAEFLTRLHGKLYGGARYRLMRTTVSADLSNLPIAVPDADADLRTGLLGPHLELDTRNSQFYPTTGWLADLMALFAGEAVGGHRDYQIYQFALSRYTSLGSRQVIAAKLNSCYADGPVPFYDLCLIGQFQDLRGYPTGQYRDRSMLTGQAEYRLRLPWRLGLVAFGGAGEVAPTFNDFTGDEVLPSGGAGLRFQLTRRTPLNLRVDYAWGKNSNALYVSVGEAF